MTSVDLRYLAPILSLRHATLVDDQAEASTLMEAIDDEDPTALASLITEHGRYVACRLEDGQAVIWAAEITPIDNRGTGETFEYVNEQPKVYRARGTDEEVIADACRLYLADSLAHGVYSQLAGWRDRIVVIIPEEVGPKESKIVRTTADGNIDWKHQYTVLDAYATYSLWVTELASEFGSGDDVVGRPLPTASRPVRHIVFPWLQRQAAEAQLNQARGSLKLALGSYNRSWHQESDETPSTAELARSLYTDRPNLSRLIAQAEKDQQVATILDAIESGDSERIIGVLK